jgi:hypothetical protein
MHIMLPNPHVVIESSLGLSSEATLRLCVLASSLTLGCFHEGKTFEDFTKAGYVRSIVVSRYGDSAKGLISVAIVLTSGYGVQAPEVYRQQYVCQLDKNEIVFMTRAGY